MSDEKTEKIDLSIGDRLLTLWPGRILRIEIGATEFRYQFKDNQLIFRPNGKMTGLGYRIFELDEIK